MVEVEEIREAIAYMDTDLSPNTSRQLLAILLRLCDKLDEHEHSIDVLSEYRETGGYSERV